MRERWRAVLGWEGLYEVSDFGRVRSLDHHITQASRAGNYFSRVFPGRILKLRGHRKQGRSHSGQDWLHVTLYDHSRKEERLVHRLVLEAFAGQCPPGKECAHRDGNPENNRLRNLRWATHSENYEDMRTAGYNYKGSPVSRPRNNQGQWQ